MESNLLPNRELRDVTRAGGHHARGRAIFLVPPLLSEMPSASHTEFVGFPQFFHSLLTVRLIASSRTTERIRLGMRSAGFCLLSRSESPVRTTATSFDCPPAVASATLSTRALSAVVSASECCQANVSKVMKRNSKNDLTRHHCPATIRYRRRRTLAGCSSFAWVQTTRHRPVPNPRRDSTCRL